MKSQRIAVVTLVAFGVLAGCTGAKQEVKKDATAQKTIVAPVKERTPDELFADGVAQFDTGKLDEAAATFGQVLAKQPKHLVAQFNLGVIAEKKGELAKAVEAYEAARKLDPTHTPSLLNLGRVLRAQEKFDQAIALYEEAVKQPGHEYDVALLNNLSVVYRLAKKFDKAEAAVRKVLSRTKDNPDAYKNLALIYYDQGNYRLAEFISANAKKLDEKDPGVYNNLGMIYLKLDDRRLALAQFQKAVQLDDKFAPGHMNLGAMALAYRDYAAAEREYAKAADLDPTAFEARLGYAMALDGQKGRDPKKGPLAGAAFEKALAIKPDSTEALCGAGWGYAADKAGWDKAVGFLEKCRGTTGLAANDQQQIDAKLKAIAAMQRSGQAQPADQQKAKEKPKQTAGGASLLDKMSDEAAKQETAPAEGGAPAPEKKDAPAPSPSTGSGQVQGPSTGQQQAQRAPGGEKR